MYMFNKTILLVQVGKAYTTKDFSVVGRFECLGGVLIYCRVIEHLTAQWAYKECESLIARRNHSLRKLAFDQLHVMLSTNGRVRVLLNEAWLRHANLLLAE
jgi:hypothetical protein